MPLSQTSSGGCAVLSNFCSVICAAAGLGLAGLSLPRRDLVCCCMRLSCHGVQAMQPKDVFKQSSLFEPSQRSASQTGSQSSGGRPASDGAASGSASAGGDSSSGSGDAAARSATALPAGPFSAYQQQAPHSRQPEVGHDCTSATFWSCATTVCKAQQVAPAELHHLLWLLAHPPSSCEAFATAACVAAADLQDCLTHSMPCCRVCRVRCLRVQR